ncbi:MAG: alpha/beta hydrolase [Nitrospirota bacterium]|nr:MAG: alpha/beta hydrolase [Nitrospirota bacterium]
MDVELSSGRIISFPFKHHKIDALYYHSPTHAEHVKNKPVILRLHGILGNLLDETEHLLPHLLAQHDYSSLTMNTLLANLGLFFGFGIFEDTMPQIDAAYYFLKEAGFKKIIIAGHGLGGCLAIRYGALRSNRSQYPEFRGVMAIATPYSLPDTIRKRWERFGSVPSYEEVFERARQIFTPAPGKEPTEDETIVIKRAHGTTTRPVDTEIYTLKTWWALAGPEATGPKTYRHIGKIKVPILLVHGLHDEMIDQHEFQALGQIGRDAGNNDVTMLELEAGHTLEGKHQELGQNIVRWLQERFE